MENTGILQNYFKITTRVACNWKYCRGAVLNSGLEISQRALEQGMHA